MSAVPPNPSITKRACDACHRRKVKCNGSNPCQNCVQAALQCTYNKIPQKKGPKGSRAKVITELRKSQEEAAAAASAGRDHGNPMSPLASPSYSRSSSDCLPPELIDNCIHEFFERMYTTVPVIHRGWLLQRVGEMGRYPESYCVVGALCVFMISRCWGLLRFVSNPKPTSSGKHLAILVCSRIIDEIKRMRNQADYVESPSISTVLTSFFLSGALFDIERTNASWFYLQEAIIFGKMLQIHTEDSYGSDVVLDTMNRRIFWVLFVTERAQALHKHRDILLSETIEFPQPHVDDHIDEMAINGLSCLYNLFRMVDEDFSTSWRSLRASSPIIWPNNTGMWLSSLQTQLSAAIPTDIKLNKNQAPDLHVTQQWLRTQVWLLSTASGSLSSTSSDESMTLLYPIKISKDLLDTLSYSELPAIDIHGVGVIEKIFDIAYSLADVLALNPVESNAYEAGPREFLSTFLNYIAALRNGETKYLGLLQAKIQEAHPTLANSLGINIPRPATHSSGTSSQVLPRMDSDSSARGSPYATASPTMGPGSAMGSSSLQFSITSPSSGPGTNTNNNSNNTDPNLGGTSSGREPGLSDNIGPSPNHPYPNVHYGSGTGY